MAEACVDFLAEGMKAPESVAIVDREGEWAYRDLDRLSRNVAGTMVSDGNPVQEARVAYLLPPGLRYATTYVGICRAGGINVPLCHLHPTPEMAYIIRDSDPVAVIVDASTKDRVNAAIDHARSEGWQPSDAFRVIDYESIDEYVGELPRVPSDTANMMVYTSGTTGKPKGVVTSQANNYFQATCLRDAWGWSAQDRLLHVLPLHHVHGIVNGFLGALVAGASAQYLEAFDAAKVWDRLVSGSISVFYGVPTIYTKLIRWYDEQDDGTRKDLTTRVREHLRLMVSGSAALPVPVLNRWEELTGHVLLERYGMTEIGMALSNPLHGQRRPGFVGAPLPGVEVRLAKEDGAPVEGSEPGEIQIKGPNVFREYWGRPDATAESFTEDGWFKSGDTAVIEEGAYRILGRNSVDIIKTGGYKVSALEIEEVLLTHPAIREVAVVGMPDDTWGEAVSAAVVLEAGEQLDVKTLREWARELLAAYKVPRALHVLDQLPRNAMGKVSKPTIKERIESGSKT